ncbi:unnamed protein product [Hermetia illucens]|uniref:Ionotropic receptor n=1 Tax=Hermetia illucens TaxID=343691 RepID=A0A7R8UTW5_HERIL|nr:uncharacterized protein LOC119656324 [Hermetia illucens]CAD7086966.1 unnamed protein product [Hermetia illucens]
MNIPRLIVQALLITSLGAIETFGLELKEIVEELTRIYDFRTIIYFTTDIRGNEAEEILLGMESPVESIPKLVWDQKIQNVKTKSIFNTNVLSIVFVSESNRGNILEVFKTALQDNLLAKVIFYFLPEMIPNITLRNFSDWLWQERILYSLMVVDNHVFTFNPFPEVSVEEVTSIESLESVFATKLVNLHRTAVRVVRSIEISRDIEYVDRNGNIQFGGYFMKTILAFIEKHNGTFVEHSAKKDMTDVGEMLDNREIDFSSVMVMEVVQDAKLSYPLSTITPCVLIPYQMELPRVFYLVLPFQKSGWILFGAGVIFFFFVMAVTDLLHGRNSASICQEVAFRVWRILTLQIHFRDHLRTNKLIKFINLLATVQFMLLLSLYQSGLSSFYTKSISAKQIDTAEDLVRTSYKILSPGLQLDFLRQVEFLPKSVLQRFVEDDSLVSSNLKQMDPKFGYLPPSEYKDFLEELEERPSTKIFHMTKMCTPSMLLSVVNQKDSPFKDIFNDIIFRLRDTGLMLKWQRDVVYELKQVDFLRMELASEGVLRPLKVDELYFVWVIYVIGIALSVVVFCVQKLMQRRHSK